MDRFKDDVADGTADFCNVMGRLPGRTNSVVVLAAHYDTKTGISATFAGANDSGSGVGLLLGLASALTGAHRDDLPEIHLVFLDGEECRREYGPADGLHGSRHLARQWRASGQARRIRAFILVDMIGDRDLTVTVPRNGTPELIKAVMGAAEAEGLRSRFSLYPGTIMDDHQPMLDAGMPAVDLIDFQYGSEPGGNDYWHTPGDTMDKLSIDSFQKMGQVVLRLLAAL